ncbi:putative quinate permease [Bienertia sinuspersici]
MAFQDKHNALFDPINPLYLHPDEGPLNVTEKLQGITYYRTWRRSVELSLVGKRKLGFITRLVTKDPQDKKKQELWDTCNNVTCNNAMEKRYLFTNGAAKYRLNKLLYDSKKRNEELENLNQLPTIIQMNPEKNALIQALEQQKNNISFSS